MQGHATATPEGAAQRRESKVAGKKEKGPGKLVEPVSLLGAMLLELMGADEGAPQPASTVPASSEPSAGYMLQLRMPDGRIEREPLLGGFWRVDRSW